MTRRLSRGRIKIALARKSKSKKNIREDAQYAPRCTRITRHVAAILAVCASVIALSGTAPAHARSIADRNQCVQASESIPAIRRTQSSKRPYLGSVVYFRRVRLEEGETIAAFGELQAIIGNVDTVMLGSFMVALPRKPSGYAVPVDDLARHKISPLLTKSIVRGAHYGIHARHATFTARRAGVYFIGIVGYGGSSKLSRDSTMRVQNNACNITIVRLDRSRGFDVSREDRRGHGPRPANNNRCIQSSDKIATVLRTERSHRPYRGNVVYFRRARLERGETVMVLGELQGVIGRVDGVMMGSFLVALPERPSGNDVLVKNLAKFKISPLLTENIIHDAHFGIHSRHGTFTAPRSGVYFFGIVGYGGSTKINRNSSIGVQNDACNISVIRMGYRARAPAPKRYR